MKIGVILPQTWPGGSEGWDPVRAWDKTIELAQEAERRAFDSIWLYDHFQMAPEPADDLTFEAVSAISALAALTSRVRLGHIVLCSGYRNPALVAKIAGTLDVISGGRFDLGIGAGWKQDEWVAYGYGFPPIGDRLAHLHDSLEIIRRMLDPGESGTTYAGAHASVAGAVNLPKGIQRPRVPIMVGGNGQTVTWRLAAKYADELNLNGCSPNELRGWLPIIRARCEEVGRDPETLALSVHVWHDDLKEAGRARIELLAAFSELGVSRAMCVLHPWADGDKALDMLAADARAAGLELA
jgi:alkanesulfonate monooxygenase SsuD/methylene tetrahydromethanopterin reductase-like flavin-dependent oxidoreductase (luciferase family)